MPTLLIRRLPASGYKNGNDPWIASVSPNFTMRGGPVEQQNGPEFADFLDYLRLRNITAALRRLILVRIVEASQINPATLLLFQQSQSRFDLF